MSLPKEPPMSLLMNMVIRDDHGLGCPGYYDDLLGAGMHERKLQATLTRMRQLYEEVYMHDFGATGKDVGYKCTDWAK